LVSSEEIRSVLCFLFCQRLLSYIEHPFGFPALLFFRVRCIVFVNVN
jgi:hypothetical protein